MKQPCSEQPRFLTKVMSCHHAPYQPPGTVRCLSVDLSSFIHSMNLPPTTRANNFCLVPEEKSSSKTENSLSSMACKESCSSTPRPQVRSAKRIKHHGAGSVESPSIHVLSSLQLGNTRYVLQSPPQIQLPNKSSKTMPLPEFQKAHGPTNQ